MVVVTPVLFEFLLHPYPLFDLQDGRQVVLGDAGDDLKLLWRDPPAGQRHEAHLPQFLAYWAECIVVIGHFEPPFIL